MPSGRTHDRITLWTLPWVTLGTWLVTRSGDLTLLVVAGFLFGGLMLSPDLDLPSRPFQRWGWFRWIWIPYQKLLRHRSVFSHGLLIGTMVRSLYLGVWLLLVAALGLGIAQLLGYDRQTTAVLDQGRQFFLQFPQLSLALLMGLELGAISHICSDWIGSTLKQVKRKGWQSLFQAKKRTTRRRTTTTASRRKTSKGNARKP